MRQCKYCGAPFEWDYDQAHGWWVPVDVESGQRHQCLRNGRQSSGQSSKRYDEADIRGAWDRGYSDGLRDGLRGGGARAQQTPNGLDLGMVLDAIRLCHPDRHDASRFELANRVTAKLLEMKRRLEAGVK